jgi:hypothetical protein
MGFVEAVGCSIGLGGCPKPTYDNSVESLLASALGIYVLKPVEPLSEHNQKAKGHALQILQMYASGQIVIKVNDKLWEPITVNENGDDIWDPEQDVLWERHTAQIDLDYNRALKTKITIEFGEGIEESDKPGILQAYYGIIKNYKKTSAYENWRRLSVNWCTNPEESHKRLVQMVSLPLDGIDCRSFPEVDFPVLSEKWCREETNIKDDTQKICNMEEPINGLGEDKYREIAEWYCDKTPEDSWCRCYNATNPESQCGGLYDQVSVVKQIDLDDTFCVEPGSIHQNICGGLCSSPTRVSRKKDEGGPVSWDTDEADLIIKRCSAAKLNTIWEPDGLGKRKLTSNTFTGLNGKWNVGEWSPRVSLKKRKGDRCSSIKHRFDALTSVFQFPRNDVVTSLKCPHDACNSAGAQYKPKNYEEGCEGKFKCGSGEATFKQNTDDVTLTCRSYLKDNNETADFFKEHGYDMDIFDPSNYSNVGRKKKKEDEESNNNNVTIVVTILLSIISFIMLIILFIM